MHWTALLKRHFIRDLSEISDVIHIFCLVKQVVPCSSFWGKPLPVDDRMTNTTLLSLRKLYFSTPSTRPYSISCIWGSQQVRLKICLAVAQVTYLQFDLKKTKQKKTCSGWIANTVRYNCSNSGKNSAADHFYCCCHRVCKDNQDNLLVSSACMG